MFKPLNLVLWVTVTEGVVHCIYKIVTWSSFGVTR